MKNKDIFSLAAIVGSFFLLLVFLRVEYAKSGREISQLNREIMQKKSRNAHIKFQLLSAQNSASVEQRAVENLQMTYAEPGSVITLEPLSNTARKEGKGLLAGLFN